jgi:hypothetical protein
MKLAETDGGLNLSEPVISRWCNLRAHLILLKMTLFFTPGTHIWRSPHDQRLRVVRPLASTAKMDELLVERGNAVVEPEDEV